MYLKITIIFLACGSLILQGCNSVPGGGNIFLPIGEEQFPAVIVLHTSGGLSKHEQNYADSLSRKGYVAVTVNWISGTTNSVSKVHEYLIAHPNVDPDRIGLVGFSKGGEVALWLASRLGAMEGQHQIAGVVSYYQGGYINPWIMAVAHPPTLFLHGEKDEYVEPIEIINYCKLQREKGTTCTYHFYEDVRHAFTQKHSPYNAYDRTATKDSWNKAISFLDTYVKRPKQ